jgi:hypothetical protein
MKTAVPRTRGLNRNVKHTLKRIFKGVATTVIGRGEDDYHHYERLLDGGTKPNLAKLTRARQIAAITLAVWRSGEAYDAKRLEATEATEQNGPGSAHVGPSRAPAVTGPTGKRTGYRGEDPLGFWAGRQGPSPQG